jgi:hypothetical protein
MGKPLLVSASRVELMGRNGCRIDADSTSQEMLEFCRNGVGIEELNSLHGQTQFGFVRLSVSICYGKILRRPFPVKYLNPLPPRFQPADPTKYSY